MFELIQYMLIYIIIFVSGIAYHHYFQTKTPVKVEPAKAEPVKPVDKIIVEFRGHKYDITEFARKHPGGKSVLVRNTGKDIEQLMLENEHSAHAYNMLEKYRIS